jgi:hypothetical protein
LLVALPVARDLTEPSCLGQASGLDIAILPKRINTIWSGIVTKRTITDRE